MEVLFLHSAPIFLLPANIFAVFLHYKSTISSWPHFIFLIFDSLFDVQHSRVFFCHSHHLWIWDNNSLLHDENFMILLVTHLVILFFRIGYRWINPVSCFVYIRLLWCVKPFLKVIDYWIPIFWCSFLGWWRKAAVAQHKLNYCPPYACIHIKVPSDSTSSYC